MLRQQEDEQTVLVVLFVMVSDLLKALQISGRSRPALGGSRRGRKAQLSLEETVALALFRYALNIKDVKHYHRHLLSHYRGWFGLPTYPNFVAQMNRVTPSVSLLLLWICQQNRQRLGENPLYFIDTSALKVCENGRIAEHKVCAGLARRGKTTQGWFYGFKIGLVIDALGHLLSVALKPGNTHDTKFLHLFRGLHGLAVGDAGFLSKDKAARLAEEGLVLMTDVKKSMKRLISPWQHTLLKMRQQVEIRLAQLKYRLQQVVSLARSPLGYLSRWMYATLAYCIFPMVEAV